MERHLRHRDAHTGPKETEISWAEVTFDVHEDGSSDERDIAIHCAESPGDLLMIGVDSAPTKNEKTKAILVQVAGYMGPGK